MIKIAVIGDYDPKKPSHPATEEAIRHYAAHLALEIRHQWLPTESLAAHVDRDGVCWGQWV